MPPSHLLQLDVQKSTPTVMIGQRMILVHMTSGADRIFVCELPPLKKVYATIVSENGGLEVHILRYQSIEITGFRS